MCTSVHNERHEKNVLVRLVEIFQFYGKLSLHKSFFILAYVFIHSVTSPLLCPSPPFLCSDTPVAFRAPYNFLGNNQTNKIFSWSRNLFLELHIIMWLKNKCMSLAKHCYCHNVKFIHSEYLFLFSIGSPADLVLVLYASFYFTLKAWARKFKKDEGKPHDKSNKINFC